MAFGMRLDAIFTIEQNLSRSLIYGDNFVIE